MWLFEIRGFRAVTKKLHETGRDDTVCAALILFQFIVFVLHMKELGSRTSMHKHTD